MFLDKYPFILSNREESSEWKAYSDTFGVQLNDEVPSTMNSQSRAHQNQRDERQRIRDGQRILATLLFRSNDDFQEFPSCNTFLLLTRFRTYPLEVMSERILKKSTTITITHGNILLQTLRYWDFEQVNHPPNPSSI